MLFFAPFLSYGVSVWDLTHPSLLDPVSFFIVFIKNAAPSAPMFDSFLILKFNDIATYQIASFVFECVHHLVLSYFSGYFISIETIHSIGNRE